MVWKALFVVAALTLPPLLLKAAGRPLSGSLLGIPYCFEPPTPARLKRSVWNAESDRVLVPHVYGWGYALNVRALARRAGLVGP